MNTDRVLKPESTRDRRSVATDPEYKGNGPPERLAAAVGNQAFSQLAREGAGILPGGRVHPDVEEAIARMRGAGQRLDPGVREMAASGLGDPLEDVRVHTGDEADALATSVAARAFTTGPDIYFARHEYRPGTGDGDQLIAHELTHVVQQRGASPSGPLMVSTPGDELESEADDSSTDFIS
jgi:hypothetical protein